jgi:thiamine-phosphate diphosphorylase
MKSGVYLIWDLPLAETIDPDKFFAQLGPDLPCAVQLRAKGALGRPAVLGALKDACQARQIPLYVNDHHDWLVPGVAGIHLGQDDGASDAFDGVRVGRSTHTLEQVREAASDARVDCLGWGPVRATASKHSADEPVGLSSCQHAVAHASGKPIIAIGGLGADDFATLKHSGVWAAAVISAVWRASEPVEALRTLVRRWRNA